MNNADPLTHVIITFHSIQPDPNITTILLFHTGWRSGVLWKQAREFFRIAWDNSLRELQNKLKDQLI
ncbi:MAG: hypothetical protein ACFFKA_17825 [Candidatus Thorarchaeota archaeon]